MPLTPDPSHVLAPLLARPPLMRADYLHGFITRLSHSRPSAIHPKDTESRARRSYAVHEGIALVEVKGPLYKGLDEMMCYWFGLASVDLLQETIEDIASRDDIKAVIFNFNSPGGVVTGIPETAGMVRSLSESKLTVAFTDTMCCSAAYWIASQTRLYTTTLSASSGSIGTYIALYDYTAMLKKAGITLRLFRRGELKAMGLIGKELTEAEAAELDADVERTNNRFLAAVTAGRGSLDESILQGQCFDGDLAVSNGLADQLVSGLTEVITSVYDAIKSE